MKEKLMLWMIKVVLKHYMKSVEYKDGVMYLAYEDDYNRPYDVYLGWGRKDA